MIPPRANRMAGILGIGLAAMLLGSLPRATRADTLAADWTAPLSSELTSSYMTMSSTWRDVADTRRGGRGRYTLAQAATAGEAQAPAGTEESAFASADEAARQSSNPLGGAFFILLNQIDNYFLDGDATNELQTLNSWALQPVIPVPMDKLLGPTWIWVNRPTFPFILHADVPDVDRLTDLVGGLPRIPEEFPGSFPPGGLPFESKSGFGDIIYFSLLGRSIPTQTWGGGDLVWAIGPTTQWPTASDDALGTGKYSIGPSGVLAFIGRKFIIGGLFQQWFSYASGGNGSGATVNFSWLNLFYFLNFPGGWQVGGTPVITADWESDDSDDRWTVPIGVGVYKTHFFGGKLPIKLGVEMQYMPVRPDTLGQVFNVRIVLAPIVPSLFK